VFRLLVVLVKLSVLTIDCLETLPARRDTFHTIVVGYRLFALIVPLNTKQTNKRFGCMNLLSACNFLWLSVLRPTSMTNDNYLFSFRVVDT